MEIQSKNAIAASAAPAKAKPLDDDANRQSKAAQKAAHQFEVMLTLQLVHEMTNTIDGSALMGKGLESRMFGSTIEWELAEHISASARLGIADELLKQISSRESANDHKVSK